MNHSLPLDHMANKFSEFLKRISLIRDIKEIGHDDKTLESYSFIYKDEEFTVKFEKGFPGILPNIDMKNPRKHPHIAKWGTVCIDRIEDIDFDIEDTEQIIIKVFNSFFSIMNLDPSKYDYTEEFGDYIKYFKAYDENYEGYIFQEFNNTEPHKTSVYSVDKFLYITDSDKIDKKYLNINKEKLTYNKALYIPLQSYFEIKDLDSKIYINEIIEHVFPQHLRIIKSLVKSTKTKNIIISFKNSNNFYNYFFLQLNDALLSINDKLEIMNIYTIQNFCIEYLKARGSSHNIQEKVLLIGVGSLGSEILYHLCKSGFDNIDICDFDNIHPNNIYRHFLGYNNSFIIDDKKICYPLKVDILKLEMESRYPSVNIKIHKNHFEDLISEDKIELSQYSHIINATGNMISNRLLNSYLYKKNINLNVIYCWIEPYGVAMHMFISNTAKKGCLNCFLHSRNFIQLAKKNNYSIKNDNCIGSFTKFGSLEVSRLSIEVVKEIILNNFNSNKHRIIKGDFTEFLSLGYELTNFANESEEILNELGEDIIYEGCEICRESNN